MYCIKCGVELADSEKQCPLCGTVVFHPQLAQPDGEKPYPADQRPNQQVSPWGGLFLVSMVFLISLVVTLLCDLRVNFTITWSGFVLGALVVGYVILVLPFWFRKPNPVVFVPCDFGVIAAYLLYINWATDGSWFLSFAFPVTGGVALIVTTVVTLTRYIRRGRLYIFGGAAIATGAFMLLVEFLLNITFGYRGFLVWSLYPLTVLVLLGLAMIVTAICPPLRESLERKFFI